ncbi:ribonuclease PH [Filifactor alocis]
MKSSIQLRDINIETGINKYAEGSVLVSFGDTRVICTASVEEKVPAFLKGTGKGWVSAEYAMLPRSTEQRKKRDSSRGKVDGRGQEIQRLIGRSLRNAIDFDLLGERTIWIDCDVIQADGGTRTASISGSFVAMAIACKQLYDKKMIEEFPISHYISAVSVGIVNGKNILDLNYEFDSKADVDLNVVMNENLEYVELQGTAEGVAFRRQQLDSLLTLAEIGCKEIIELQKNALGKQIVSLIEGIPFEEEPIEKNIEEKEIKDFLSSYEKNDSQKYDFVLATSNPHKVEELQKLIRLKSVEILSLDDVGLKGIEIVEDGDSFEENALIKAREIAKRTGKIAIADDSGLSVDILKGQPGIYSARFAGEPTDDHANNEKLLDRMKDYEESLRLAKFVCVIAVVFPNGLEKTFKGITMGRIGFEYCGEHGFGYDPLFLVDGTDKTYAEMTQDEKNRVSHRARALKNMNHFYEKYFR